MTFRMTSRMLSSIASTAHLNQSKTHSNSWLIPTGSLLIGGTLLGYSLSQTVEAEEALHPAPQPWTHAPYAGSFDTASLRRGFEVYRQVCATCHSLKFIKYRHLVGVTHTEEQAKALAASVKIRDGPDVKGEYFDRPRILTDPLPKPYENDELARDANAGALPPDLSLLAKARHGGADYMFSLLTGYRKPPVGVELREGLHYNPYFPGGAIAMRQALQDGGVEYEDGTPATMSQQAKDVVSFLVWTAEPKREDRKKLGLRVLSTIALMIIGAGYYKRFQWSLIKTRRVSYLE